MKSSDVTKKVETVLLRQPAINWFIIDELDEINTAKTKSADDEFLRKELPFGRRLRYLSLSLAGCEQFDLGLEALFTRLALDTVALGNLFLLLAYTICPEYTVDWLDRFNRYYSEAEKQQIFEALVQSLNEHYYRGSHYLHSEPKDVPEWIQLFSLSSYRSDISDPSHLLLQLLSRQSSERHIRLTDFIQMNPLVRSHFVSWFGMKVASTSKELSDLLNERPSEICFLAAMLMKEARSDSKVPEWLAPWFIHRLVTESWKEAGRHLFTSIFTTEEEPPLSLIYQYLRVLFSEVLSTESKPERERFEWMKELSFPEGYMALCSWMHLHKPACLEQAYPVLGDAITQLFNKLIDEIPILFTYDSWQDPLKTYLISKERYRLMFPYLFLGLCYSKLLPQSLKKWLLELKVYFYGSYKSQHLGIQYVEFLILTALSIIDIEEADAEVQSYAAEYLHAITDTVLVPYVHLSERNDYVWDRSTKKGEYSNSGCQLMNKQLRKLHDNPNWAFLFDKFLRAFSEIKVAKWPFED